MSKIFLIIYSLALYPHIQFPDVAAYIHLVMFVNTSQNVHPISLILVTKKTKQKNLSVCSSFWLCGTESTTTSVTEAYRWTANPAHDSLSALRSHLNNIYSFL